MSVRRDYNAERNPLTLSRLYPKYALLGTYRCEPHALQLDSNVVSLTHVWPNVANPQFRYNINIPFAEISDLYYCNDDRMPSIFIKPTLSSNLKLQEFMNLSRTSENGLQFNVHSKDKREQFMIIVLSDSLSSYLIDCLRLIMRTNYSHVKLREYHPNIAKLELNAVLMFANHFRVSSKRKLSERIRGRESRPLAKRLRTSGADQHSDQALATELTCSVCHELYIDAVLLDCSHTFCSDCVPSNKCPICGQSVKSRCRQLIVDKLVNRIEASMTAEQKCRREIVIFKRKAKSMANIRAANTIVFAALNRS